ncbi:hypothetical protein AGLY_015357 [Aphis glycines]|uniref:Uncharacterized protein n=1 Tax=Aphis glycines TaxID=307491 RepID=A0A6G0T1N8_APHGL|nr:hypothetical protein AGLY_015357 [Aphis glycines]
MAIRAYKKSLNKFKKTKSINDHIALTEENIKRDLELNFYHQENAINQPFNITKLHNALSGCKSKSPEKAYDMIWRNRVLKIIQEFDINGKMFIFLQNFLKNRTIQVKAHNELSNTYLTENGLPQGSVIRIPKPIKHLLFSDDCHIYCSGQNIKTTMEILQQALNILQNWSNMTRKVNVSVSKTVRKTENLKLFLNNSEIPFCKSLRILGMIFDNKLNWTQHLKKLKSSCKMKMNIMKTLSHHTWGADTKSLLNIYKSLIMSRLNYGSIVYSTAKENLLKILDPLHNEGIRISIGAFRTSPIDIILCYAGELTLKLQREKDILIYGIKRKSTPNQTFKIHTSVKNKITFQKFPPWLWKIQLNTELTQYNKHETNPTIIISHFKEIIQNKYSSFLQIYTDASKSQHGTGFAIIKDETNILHKLPQENSIFTAENYALLETIRYINITSSNNNILTRSPSTPKPLLEKRNNPKHPNRTIFYRKKYRIYVGLSHIGISGNEIADKSADIVTKTILRSTITDIPAKDINKSVRNKINMTWQSYWDSISPSNKLKKIKRCTKKWHYLQNLNKRQEVTLTRVRIGHSFLTHSFLISKDPPPICSKCQEDLTIQYIILDCPDLQNIRSTLSIPNNLEEALHEDNTIQILNFLTKINIVNNL